MKEYLNGLMNQARIALKKISASFTTIWRKP